MSHYATIEITVECAECHADVGLADAAVIDGRVIIDPHDCRHTGEKMDVIITQHSRLIAWARRAVSESFVGAEPDTYGAGMRAAAETVLRILRDG